MKTSEKGISFLKALEGCRLIAYRDIKGIFTIGFGHTENVKEGDIITLEQAEKFLAQDLFRFENCINSVVKVELLQHEFDALVSLCFNLGVAEFKTTRLLKYINLKDFPKAAEEFITDMHPKEILGRRKKERELFVTGNYGIVSRETI
jgi:lysozyme